VRYIKAAFSAISAITLAWGGLILCIWTVFQSIQQINNPETWQILNNTSTRVAFQSGMVANAIGIMMLLSFSSSRRFRGRWEHYALTMIAIFLIILDVIGWFVLKAIF